MNTPGTRPRANKSSTNTVVPIQRTFHPMEVSPYSSMLFENLSKEVSMDGGKKKKSKTVAIQGFLCEKLKK
jgi:hypothetical protein